MVGQTIEYTIIFKRLSLQLKGQPFYYYAKKYLTLNQNKKYTFFITRYDNFSDHLQYSAKILSKFLKLANWKNG
ncbi:hypothetical protein BN1088_1430939 [Sphingobacterium sp. PM2-P1-29]|nr:hypothetical protein BN1088_1430939 [Sphingobacterium sp. PM2-P1-29]